MAWNYVCQMAVILLCGCATYYSEIIILTDEEKKAALSYQESLCGSDRLCSKSNNTIDGNCRLCPSCQCDDLCDKYGDCCADRTLQLLGTPNFNPSRYRCHSNAFKLIYDKKNDFSFHSVQKCSIRQDQELVDLCENPDRNNITLAVPAQTRQDLYRNQFCAQCNGDTDYTLWAVKAECTHLVWLKKGMTSYDMIMSYVNNTGCAIFLHPPSKQSYRECYTPEDRVISKCNETGLITTQDDSLNRSCMAYSSPIYLFKKVYRNIFCYICNNGKLEDSFIPPPSCKFDTVYPFSVVMDPKAIQITQEPVVLSCECDPGHIYDNYTGECLYLECTADRVLRNEVCFSVISSTKGLVYLLEVKLVPEAKLTINATIDTWVNTVAGKLKAFFRNQFGGGGVAIGLFRINARTRGSEIIYITIYTKMKIIWEMEIGVIESALIDIRESQWNISIDSKPIAFAAEPYSTDPTDTTMYPKMTVDTRDDGDTFYTLDHGYTMDLTQNHSALYASKTLKCPSVNVTLGIHYEYDVSTDTMYRIDSNETIDVSLFEPTNSSSGVLCHSVFKTNVTVCGKTEFLTPVQAASLSLMYVSLVAQIIAITCLFLTFIIYCIFKKLRTISGQITMSLVFTLFVCMTLYAFGHDKTAFPLTCLIIGIATHFFLICSITWVTVGTIHTFMELRRVLDDNYKEGSKSKKYVLYFFISMIIPGAIVGANVGGNYTTSDGDDFGYGDNICFLSNYYSAIISMCVPLGLFLILNGGFHVATMTLNKKITKENRNLNAAKSVIYTYIRVAIITVITWSFALVSTLVDSDIFKYIFAILCGLLGVFVFIVFACRRNIFDLIRACCMKKNMYKSDQNPGDEIRMTYTGKDLDREETCPDIENDYASIACVKRGDFETNDLNGKLSLESDMDDNDTLKSNMNKRNITKDLLAKHISDVDSIPNAATSDVENDEAVGDALSQECDDHYGLLSHARTKDVKDPYNVMFNPVFQ